jgi:Holliday junction resolvase-like predicted endonuclease
LGETLAAQFLTRKGLSIVSANVRVGRGEVDLLAMDGGQRVVVEVRTTRSASDPIDAVDAAKRAQVRRLAGNTGRVRVDFVGIGLGDTHLAIHWVPGDC